MRLDEKFDYYTVAFVNGDTMRVRVPRSVASPTFAIEHGVPMFVWPLEEGLPRFVINPGNVLYVQEIDPPEEAF